MRSLRKDGDFKKVFGCGKRAGSPTLTVFVLENSIGHGRAGIICSKKISKKAVERNKIRRRVREALMKIPLGSNDIILLPRKSWLKDNFKKLSNDLAVCLRRSGIEN